MKESDRCQQLFWSGSGQRDRVTVLWIARLALLVAATVLPASRALAQGQLLGAIHGVIKDQQGGVLPGVNVMATPNEDRPPITTTTNPSGVYILTDLQPGEYVIKADLPGFASVVQPNVLARAGTTLSLDLIMKVGGLGEVVTVTRDSPLLESKSAATTVNVSGDLQRALPTSPRRNWSDALTLTPGVIAADSTFGGLTQNYVVHGSNLGSNVLQLDGADVASATVSQTFYVAFSGDLIADVQVTTAGVDASAPLGTGAILSVATKSGTNQLSGSLGLVGQPTSWNSSNVPGGTSPKVSLVQPDASLGGPIRKDRMWFFGAYRRIQASTGVGRTAAQIDTLKQLDPSFRPFDLQNRGNLYFFKANANVSPRHQVSGFYQSDFNRANDGTAQDSTPSITEIGGRALSARLTSTWGNALTSEFGASYNDKTFHNPSFDAQQPFRAVYRSTTLSSGRPTGTDYLGHIGANNSLWSDQPATKTTISLSLQWLFDRGPGSHDLKFGTYLQPRLVNESTIHYVNGGLAFEQLGLRNPSDLSSAAVFSQTVYPETTPQYASRGSDLAAYAQDTWHYSRATVTTGARIDKVRYRDTLFNVTTQDSINVGPRVGVNYALTNDARSTLRFTLSRIPDRVTGAAFAGIASPDYMMLYDLDGNGTLETADLIPGSNSLSRSRVFDPDLHQPLVTEFTAGYRQQMPGAVTFDIGIVRRLMKERFTMVEVNGIYDGGVFRGYQDVSQNDVYNLTNNIWNWPVYTAFEAIVTKRTSRLELLASYTRQWQHLAGTWQPNDPASFIQPSAFPNDRGIGNSTGSLSSTSQANSLSGTSMSLSAVSISPWQDHVFRGGLNANVGGGFTGAVTYTFQSGPWSGPIVKRLAAPDAAFGPGTIVLPNGRSVQNPLATVIRFAYPTRGDGQFHLDPVHVLNFRVAKTLSIQRTKLLLLMDVFNATNNDADQGLLGSGNVLGGVNYKRGTNRQVPRGAQIGLRVSF